MFRDRMLEIVQAHDSAAPLLLFYTPHVAHCPLQVPRDYLDRFAVLTNGTDETACSSQTPSINPNGSQFACRAQCVRAGVRECVWCVGALVFLCVVRGCKQFRMRARARACVCVCAVVVRWHRLIRSCVIETELL